jgi:leucyl-tRNA synthetase
MSKSKGNVVNPDEITERYGADVLRVYELFMGPFDQPVPWDMNGIEGVRKFLDRVWQLGTNAAGPEATPALETLHHQTLKKLSEGIEQLQFNTCVSQLMILTNAFQDHGGVPSSLRATYLQMIAPFAPHLAEELWSMQETGSVHLTRWPRFDANKLRSATYELVVQVAGKVRAKLVVSSDIEQEAAVALAMEDPGVQKWLQGSTPKQIVFVKGRLLNLVG